MHGIPEVRADPTGLIRPSLAAVSSGFRASEGTGPSTSVSFEKIEGSTVKRVILSEKAAERLGIETGKVAEEPIVRNQMVGGKIVTPKDYQPEANVAGGQFGSFGQAASMTSQPAPA